MAEFLDSYAIWALWVILGLGFLSFLVTAPCHAVFLLPFVGLPMFWLLPLGYALPVNLIIWLATPFLYWLITKAMRKPVQDGFQSLVGTKTEVVSRLETGHATKYLVRAHGELWSAYSTDTLQPGEPANIVAVKGIGVVIEPVRNDSHPGKTGADDNERHCH